MEMGGGGGDGQGGRGLHNLVLHVDEHKNTGAQQMGA
jgi:hypothetical protein